MANVLITDTMTNVLITNTMTNVLMMPSACSQSVHNKYFIYFDIILRKTHTHDAHTQGTHTHTHTKVTSDRQMREKQRDSGRERE